MHSLENAKITFKEDTIPILYNLFQSVEREYLLTLRNLKYPKHKHTDWKKKELGKGRRERIGTFINTDAIMFNKIRRN